MEHRKRLQFRTGQKPSIFNGHRILFTGKVDHNFCVIFLIHISTKESVNIGHMLPLKNQR